MGRTPRTVTKTFSAPGGIRKRWLNYLHGKKLDFVDQVKAAWIVIRSNNNKIKTSSIELVFY
jgi:hypothetical protein